MSMATSIAFPSSQRLERECQRNIERVWLTGQLAPDFKTIADFRKDSGKAIREVCRAFVALCRELDLLSAASVAIDGSEFKAVNARDKNFTEAKMKHRHERIDDPALLTRSTGGSLRHGVVGETFPA
jgi:transposase